MTPIEIMAFVIAMLIVIKLIVIFINPRRWAGVASFIYKNKTLTAIVAFTLAAITLFYLLEELTIIQIFAAMLFLTLLMILGSLPHHKEITELQQSLLKDKSIVKRAWLSIIIWLLLAIWVLYEIFITYA